MNRIAFLLFTVGVVFATIVKAQKYTDTSLDFETRAMDLVDQMTLEEKISQLGNTSPAIPRLGVDAYDWWNECLHGVARAGVATVFPQAIAMAATFDTSMMYDVADIISDEARAKHHEFLRNNDYGRYKGLTMWSPNVNIFRDPRWGRGHETYGEDPYLTGQMGMQFVKGLQGNDDKYYKVVATAKHFAVHNGPESERHVFNVTPNTRDLWETYLPAFEDLMVGAKAYSIMGAYNRVDGESASGSWMLLEDILRDKWSFDGFVVSDCGAIYDIYGNHKIVNTAEEAAAVGLRRGCDLNCGGVYQSATKNAVEDGLIDEGEIDLAVYRLMLARMKLGMFDPVEMVEYAQIPYSVNDSEEHDVMALKMAQKAMTLLKNDGILPLNRNKIKKLVVVGPNANSTAPLYANYHGTASNPVTVLQGIQQELNENAEINYIKGCPLVINELTDADFSVIDTEYLHFTNNEGEKISGLKGAYFKGIDLEGEPVMVRNDKQINFLFGTGSPTETELAQGIITSEQALGADYFSIRWTGKLTAPVSGKFKIGIKSDDGCRIWINNELIAQDWSDHGMQATTAELHLERDKVYDLKVEYYENTQGAGAQFIWHLPDDEASEDKDPMSLSDSELAQVKNADVAVFVGGLDATWEGEEMGGRDNIEGFNRGDRTKIELPAVQQKALRDMMETETPVVFVLMAGSAVSFDGLEEEIPAILMSWYPGQRGGNAVADVLFGNYNPAGRLPVTFYKSTSELADFRDYNMRAGKGFTYRYYKGESLFSFGHGLSYTKFQYSDIDVSKSEICQDDEFTVSLKVKNVGSVDGEEVVQLYVRDLESDLWMPNKQLRGFKRIALEKGEEKLITFRLKADNDLRYYDSTLRRYAVDPGMFEIQVGASSEDIRLTTKLQVE
ncbi:MAG: glycoside hydrolase family 3 C-terminal domain-containing protein [Prolixibacteraceae bacterium]|jgi:beta-glucosidase|nr:glycoside hydrolase family 3 C-terminal domain-containing protein [Prolixibacteraceae bacterium]